MIIISLKQVKEMLQLIAQYFPESPCNYLFKLTIKLTRPTQQLDRY